jgi:AraC-like DNA-binding protein
MSQRTVAAGYARSLLDVAVARGAGEADLLARAGLSGAELDLPDTRVPIEQFERLMRAAKELCNDPALALHFGAAAPFNEVSIVGLIAYASGTMGEAFEQVNRYAQLVIEVDGHETASRFAIVRRAGGVWIEDRRRNPNAFPELTESTWARFVTERARMFPNRAPYVLEVNVTHARPAYADVYANYFAMPVVFSAGWNALRIAEGWLAEPTGQIDRYVFGVFNAHAEALLKSLVASSTIRGQIEAAVIPILHTGRVTMTGVARKLGFSRSTLHRRLLAEGETFESILDDLRRRMALDYLEGRKVSVNETAYLVGFSDPSAFSRAFRRWTGTSPGKHRSGEA